MCFLSTIVLGEMWLCLGGGLISKLPDEATPCLHHGLKASRSRRSPSHQGSRLADCQRLQEPGHDVDGKARG